MTDPNLRATRLKAWALAITALLIVGGYLSSSVWVPLLGGLL